MVRRLTALWVPLAAGCSFFPEDGRDPHDSGDSGSPPYSDLYRQESGKADIVFVIDTSSSMTEEQEALASGIAPFLATLAEAGIDYHIGSVSTNMEDVQKSGKLQGAEGYLWVDPETPGAEAVLSGMLRLGTDAHYVERGRAALWSALEVHGDEANAGFFRDDAELVAVVLSDEDDQSGEDPVGLDTFIGWLGDRWPNPGQLSFSSIVGEEVAPNLTCETAMQPGVQYLAVTEAVGGIAWSVCDAGMADPMARIAALAGPFRAEFPLTRTPVEGSLFVWADLDPGEIGYVENVDWVYVPSRNSVLFVDRTPPLWSLVHLEYEPR